MFINLTNHPSEKWSSEQIDAAREYGGILDMAFPLVSPEADEKQIQAIADDIVRRVIALNPSAVCCQGEMTLTYSIVSALKKEGILVLAATSSRETVEKTEADGSTHKTAVFRFCRFRAY